MQLAVCPQEKIYVQTDKAAYLSGERIWLRAHLVNAADGRPSLISRYVYVELLSPFSELVERIMLRPDSLGVFAGHLDLKEELPEGDYTIRSYTRYMTGEGETAFFRKSVRVLDPYSLQLDVRPDFSTLERGMLGTFSFLERPGGNAVMPELVTVKLPGKGEQVLKGRGERFSVRLPADSEGKVLLLGIRHNGRKYRKYIGIPVRPDGFEISLLPEGGYLVPGRVCRVGVKCLRQDGLGMDISGTVLDSRGQEVGSFGNLHRGVGSFSLKAAEGEHYTAVCRTKDGVEKRIPLPEPNPEARVLQLLPVRNRINVSLLKGPRAPEGTLYLLLHQGGRPVVCREWKADESFVTLDMAGIPEDVLKPGILNFVLFDGKFEVLSERLFFHAGKYAIEPDGMSQSRSFGTREYVNADFRLKPSEMPSAAGFTTMAVSVTDAHSAVADTVCDLVSTLLLSSEIRGRVEAPSEYLLPGNKSALDALMLTQGWRRYDIPEVLKGRFREPQAKAEKFQEIRGHAEGFAFNSMKDGRVSLYAILGSMTSVNYAPLGRDGRFSFSTEFPEGTEITVQTQTRKGQKGNILELDGQVFPDIAGAALKTGVETPASDDYMRQADEQYLRLHGIRSTMLDAAVVTAATEEKPSDSIWYSELNSTTPLTSSWIEEMHFTDILSLYLNTPGVVVRRGSGGNYLSTTRSELPVLPVIDDVVLPEYDVMTLSPRDIDNIFVIKDYTSQFGMHPGFSGAVVIKTSHGAATSKSKSYNIARVKPLGYQQKAEFWSPKYESPAEKESPEADLRTTIYWNPAAAFGSDGVCSFGFWTADKGTEYLLRAEGVTSDGRMINVSRTIKIEER